MSFRNAAAIGVFMSVLAAGAAPAAERAACCADGKMACCDKTAEAQKNDTGQPAPEHQH